MRDSCNVLYSFALSVYRSVLRKTGSILAELEGGGELGAMTRQQHQDDVCLHSKLKLLYSLLACRLGPRRARIDARQLSLGFKFRHVTSCKWRRLAQVQY